MRKVTIAAFLLALVMLFASCSLIQVNPERDMDRTVMVVGDIKVDKATYASAYYNLVQMYTYLYGFSLDALEEPETAQRIQDEVIASVIEQKILEIKAKEYGCYDFTQEELDEIDATYDENLSPYLEDSKTKITQDEANQELSEEELSALIQEDLKATLDEFNFVEEDYRQLLKDQKAVEKLTDIIMETDDPTESEIQSVYTQKVEAQKNGFADGSTNYDNTLSGGSTVYYYMPDTRKVRQILIGLPEDVPTQLSTLRESGETEQADALAEEELAKIKEEADMVYGLLEEGGDFKALIDEYNDDSGMESKEYYMISKANTTFDIKFVDGAFSLENVGDYTAPIASDFGYYIIQYYEEVPEGAVSIDEVKDEVINEIVSAEEQELYAAKLEEWREEIKTRIYKSRLELDLD